MSLEIQTPWARSSDTTPRACGYFTVANRSGEADARDAQRVTGRVVGDPMRERSADVVGADGYAADAAGATKKAKELLEQRERVGLPVGDAREAAALEDRAHEGEERDREQQIGRAHV